MKLILLLLLDFALSAVAALAFLIVLYCFTLGAHIVYREMRGSTYVELRP